MSIFFDNTNKDQVQNGPTSPTDFSVPQPTLVTHIHLYHWNNGQGSFPGTVSLMNTQTRVRFGPYPVLGSRGQGGAPNADWDSNPNVVIPSGDYVIECSSPQTWSHNATSRGAGFAWIEGSPTVLGTNSVLFDNTNVSAVQNNPVYATRFELAQPTLITEVSQYHWNNGQGAPGGTISLRSALASFGPFPAISSGASGVPDVNWVSLLNIVLPAGKYVVESSNPQTWSQNTGSGEQGFTKVYGG